MTTTIDRDDPRLTAYALGELHGDELSEFERLLAESSEASEALAEIQEMTASLRREFSIEPTVGLTDEQRQRVERIAAGGASPAEAAGTHPTLNQESVGQPTTPPSVIPSRRERSAHRWAVLATAAATVALGAVAMTWMPPSPGTSRPWRTELDSRSSITLASRTPFELAQSSKSDNRPFDFAEASKQSGDVSSPTSHVVDQETTIGKGYVLSSSSAKPGVATTSPRGESQSSLPHSKGLLTNSEKDREARDRWMVTSQRERGRTLSEFESDGLLSIRGKQPATWTDAVVAGGKDGSRPTGLLYRELSTELSESDFGRSRDKYLLEGERAPGTEAYSPIIENPFLTPAEQPLSTFSVDVDTASYANVRRFLNQGQLPPADAVRIEELINYFKYDDPAPVDGQPFAVKAEAAPCPWQKDHYVARISLKAKEIAKQQRPPTNLVFLLDVSGSMQSDNKLPLVKRAMSLLVEELGERDRVSIVTYAGDAGLKLEPTAGSDQTKIMQAIEALSAGGSTNGAAAINMAYEQALRHFSKDSANRVILCTDGDFNVGVSSDEALVNLIEQQAKSGVFLSIFGFGMGNLKDSKLEKLADKGNGHYGYIDDLNEARKNFNEELMGTLYTVAKDVKLQVEFNPLTVGAYRLIGYENRVMAAEDFNNDAKDAGEIGAGHTVTALYEIVPRGKWNPTPAVDPLKYTTTGQTSKPVEPKANVPADAADDLFTVKLRYKQPDATASVHTVDVVIDDIAGKKVMPSRDLLWSASVASFGMQLRHSKHAGTWTMADVLETARGAKGDDSTGRRGEFIELVKQTMKLIPTSPSNPKLTE